MAKKEELDAELVMGLCVDVYNDQLEADCAGNAAGYWRTRLKMYNGDEKKAAAHRERDAQFYRSHIDAIIKVLLKREELPSKPSKKKDGKFKLDPEYVYDLSVDVFTTRRGKAKTKAYLDTLIEKYKDKEKAQKRYRDKAQIDAPVVRSFLKALEARGMLPKGARG